LKGKLCSVCAHRERAGIDLALARGVSVSALSRRYDVSTDSLYRHRKTHLTAQLRAKLIAGPDIEIDLDRLRESESQSLLANLVALRHRLFASLDVAEECGDSNMVCRVTGQIHQNLELTGKLLGDLGVGTTVNNVLVLPAYVEMRMELINALRPFPEAARAVAAALHRLEAKSAESIKNESERPLFEVKTIEHNPSANGKGK
jgi:transposase-like protein